MSHYRDPLSDLFRLQDRMNRVFDELTQRQTRKEDAVGAELEKPEWVPLADVDDREQEYVVAVDLPGIDRAKLGIEIENNRLLIRGERPSDRRQEHRGERPAGRFLRGFEVPADVDQGRIDAAYKDGVLRIRLPKRSEDQAGRVRIQVQ